MSWRPGSCIGLQLGVGSSLFACWAQRSVAEMRHAWTKMARVASLPIMLLCLGSQNPKDCTILKEWKQYIQCAPLYSSRKERGMLKRNLVEGSNTHSYEDNDTEKIKCAVKTRYTYLKFIHILVFSQISGCPHIYVKRSLKVVPYSHAGTTLSVTHSTSKSKARKQ